MKTALRVDIRQGKLDVGASARAALTESLRTWTDGPATLTVERDSATRSVQANAYYWAVVIKELADHTGYTPDETHDALKILFLPKDVALATGMGEVVAEFVIGGSTKGLTATQFFDYVETVRMWAFEKLDVSIPPPDPEWRARALEQELAEIREQELAALRVGEEVSQ